MRLTKRQSQFLAHQRVVRVATVDARGVPHVVPVCAVVADRRLYFASDNGGAKIRNLRANPQVTVVADDYTEAWAGLRGVMVSGTARLYPRGPVFQRVRRLLYAKYPQYASEAALAAGDAVVVEVTLARAFAWGFEE